MAVFWKHIKGTGNAENNDTGFWSWIEWATPSVSATPESARTMEWSPTIKCNNRNTTQDAVDLGHIITSDNFNQEIKNLILIQELTAHEIWLDKDGLSMYINDDAHSVMSIKEDSTSSNLELTIRGKMISTSDINNTGDIINTGDITNIGDIITSEKCEAKYFNALSDKRAKENIYPLMSSALDIINAVQVYTFNYKNSDKTTIGLIAQEMLPYNLGGATFVSNPDATGEDGDYMSITESKLVYLLLKGMQEQQEQINQLKQRIMDLEGK